MSSITKITVLRGYSASGKSTWAKTQNAVVVSRDAIREFFPGDSGKRVLKPEDEVTVTEIEIAMITAAVKRGQNIIVDNTNLVAKFARRYVDLAVKLGAEWEVKDFPTDLVTCVRQNHGRQFALFGGGMSGGVPDEVIQKQALRFPIKNWPVIEPSVKTSAFEPYVPDTSLPIAIGFDLDGTLAHMGNRSPYDPTLYHEDEIDDVLLGVLRTTQDAGNKVIILTGRDEKFRRVCSHWLATFDIFPDDLFMRPEGDTRNDAIIKSEMVDNLVAPKYNLVLHYDDRQRVVDALRAKGIKVAQVAPGDF